MCYRNPDSSHPDGPWCYTRDPMVEWQYCGIPRCDASPTDDDIPRPNVNHVLHIGLDGLHATCFQNASSGAQNMMRRLAEKGAYTFDARTALETWSAPGWTNHVCGMSMEVTGVTSNSWTPPWMGNDQQITPITSKRIPLPCGFMHLKGMDENIRVASFMNWRWIYWMGNRGAAGSVDVDLSCSGTGVGGDACDELLIQNATDYLGEIASVANQSYTFLHIDMLDHHGHTYTWCNNRYLEAVNVVDDWVGLLLDAIDDEEGDEWLVFLSSDHGGSQWGHGGWKDNDLRIPMFIRGPGVKRNYEIQSSISNEDIVPTAVWALGYPPSKWWTGDVMMDTFA